MFDSSANGRSVGVGIPAGQLSPGTGQPRTVTGFIELRSIGLEYVDDAGNRHRTIAMVDSAGTWYLPPNGENFAATMKSLAPGTWLSKELTAKLAEQDASVGQPADANVPKADTTDVL